jgi:hypothetical protein
VPTAGLTNDSVNGSVVILNCTLVYSAARGYVSIHSQHNLRKHTVARWRRDFGGGPTISRPARFTPRLRQSAIVILARQAALREVKRRIRSQGRAKLSTLSAATLTRLGNEYLLSHPELIAEAAASPIVQNL